MEKMFYTIGEVAEELGESVSCIRFWTKSFPELLSPRRNAKGNRIYTPEQLETLRKVQFLLKERGLTIEGAQKQMHEDSDGVERRMKVMESLQDIRARLLEVRKSLDLR